MAENAFQLLKKSVKLSEFIARYTSQAPKPTGGKGKFRSNCPIHGGTNNNTLSIDDNAGTDKCGLWKCMAECGGGTLIDFYMKVKDITDLSEAISGLATELNVTLPETERSPRQGASRSKILKALDRAATYGNDNLLDLIDNVVEYAAAEESGADHDLDVTETDQAVFQYVSKRSLAVEDDGEWEYPIIEEYRLGFFPSSDGQLVDELVKACDGDRESLISAGVLRKDERGRVYCPYRGRLIIPILNERGDIIGLAGRTIDDVKSGSPDAKYINPTDTPVYQKSGVLYGIDQLKRRDGKKYKKTRTVVVSEGYFDSIAINETFLDNDEVMGVAVCGVAFTSGHIELVNSVDKVILLFDSDTAGQAAMAKNMWMLNHLGDRIYATTLSDKDPWETFTSDPKILEEMINRASPLSEVIAGAAYKSIGDPAKFDKWVSESLSVLDQSGYRDKILDQAAKLRDQSRSTYSRRISLANVKKSNSRSDEESEATPNGVDQNMKSLIRRIFQMTDAEKDSVLGALADAKDDELERLRRWLPVYTDIDFQAFLVASLGYEVDDSVAVEINRTLATLIPGDDEPVENIYIVLRNMIMNLSQNATSSPDSEYDIDILASQIVSLRGIDSTIKAPENQNKVLAYLLDLAVAV